MRAVRIQSLLGTVHLVDVVCDCGANGLKNTETNERSFKHIIDLDGPDVVLSCDCGASYRVHPQSNHFHVMNQ